MDGRQFMNRLWSAPASAPTWYLGPWPAPYDSVPAINSSYVRVVYQPKPALSSIWPNSLAVDQAGSLINIANPGTNDGTDLGTLVWSSDNGWEANDDGYVDTGVIQESTNETFIIAHTETPQLVAFLGAYEAEDLSTNIRLIAGFPFGNGIAMTNFGGGGAVLGGRSGDTVTGINGQDLYQGGIKVLTGMSSEATGPMTHSIYIMNANNWPEGVLMWYGFISAFVWYNALITEPQFQAVSAAMEVIRSTS
jgi:hypothetical protein